MLPTAIIPLQHQFEGGIGRVNIDIGEEDVAGIHWQCARGVIEVMLVIGRVEI